MTNVTEPPVEHPSLPRVLVAYPPLFNCYSKLERKLDFLCQNMQSPTLLAMEETRQLVQRYAEEHQLQWQLYDDNDSKRAEKQVSHAVVFDDGQEFTDLVQHLKRLNIPVRKVAVTITRVINLRTDTRFAGQNSTADYEYIGRGSYWGNPHSMYEEGEDRDEVIRKFRYDFEYDKFPNKDPKRVHELAGKTLGCYCKPAPCHGDVLADFLNAFDDGL